MENPLFYHSGRTVANAYGVASVSFFALVLYEWIVKGPYLSYLVLALALLIIFVRPYRFYATQRVQGVFFYENYCRLKGKNLDREVPYSEIREVSLISPPFLAAGPGIRITFKAEDETFLIPVNPKNRSLGMDLYSWLKAKVGTAQVAAAV